ncbi:MAG: hypothetical protein ABI995_11435 [Acidobacteriota bacterium]
MTRILTAGAYDEALGLLLARASLIHSAMHGAGIPYRIIGGLACFFHVEERDPAAARLTPDIDVAVNREDLPRIIKAAAQAGLSLETPHEPRVAGRKSVFHLVYLNEKVRPEYLEPMPSSEPVRTEEGILIAPVADLVRMKLTSYRLRDKVHIQDMDGVGLITSEIEAGLSDALRARLAEVRAQE